MRETLIFAYGSLLLETDARRTMARPRWLGRARLPGYRLAFTKYSPSRGGGVVDVTPEEEGEVWGGVYAVDAGDLRALDRREGHPTFYRRAAVAVELWEEGRELDAPPERREAETYQVVKKSPTSVPPALDYLALVLAGARERSLPPGYLRRLDIMARSTFSE